MWWTVILKFLKANWLPILIGIVILSTLSYIGVLRAERTHYKNKAIEVQETLDRIIEDNKSRVKKLEDKNSLLTQEMSLNQKAAETYYKEGLKEYNEKIALKKELAAVKLDLATVKLYNSTTVDYTSDSQGITKTESGHDGEATTSKETTLADLLTVAGENNINHLKCIDVVNKWQSFWIKYVKNVEESNAAKP